MQQEQQEIYNLRQLLALLGQLLTKRRRAQLLLTLQQIAQVPLHTQQLQQQLAGSCSGYSQNPCGASGSSALGECAAWLSMFLMRSWSNMRP